MGSVVAAYTVAWTILMGYLLSLASRQRQLTRAVEALKQQIDEK